MYPPAGTFNLRIASSNFSSQQVPSRLPCSMSAVQWGDMGGRVTPTTNRLDVALVERARAEVAGRTDIPSIEEARRMLAAIPGNWSDDIIADRGEY